ncbi:hypothetical protein D3C77_582700 [compost metagenome]
MRLLINRVQRGNTRAVVEFDPQVGCACLLGLQVCSKEAVAQRLRHGRQLALHRQQEGDVRKRLIGELA